MLKNFGKRLADMNRCVRFFLGFAWKTYPQYYLFVVMQIIVDSIGPFINIIGTKYLINEIAYQDKRNPKIMIFWVAFICVGTLLYRSLHKFVTEKQYYSCDIVDTEIRKYCGKRCMKMKFEYTENTKVLDDVKKAGRAIEEADVQTIIEGFVGIVSGFIVLSGVFVLIINCSIWLLVPIILSFVVSTLATMKSTKLREEYYKTYTEQLREQDYYMLNLTESRYAKDIRVYKASRMILDNQKVMGENIYNVAKKSFKRMWKYEGVDGIVSQVCTTAIFIILGTKTLIAKITIGEFSSLVQSTNEFKNAMERVSRGIFSLRYATSVLQHFIDFIDAVDMEEDNDLNNTEQEIDLTTAPVIEFKNVSFKYPNTDRYILQNVNTVIRSGEHLAIVGQNGAGKTTFIKLLCRLYDVTEGEILLNGVNINKYSFSDYIKMLSVVFQDYKLMAFSILENVAMDASDSPDARKRMKELSDLVELGDWIDSLEKKENTNIYKLFDEAGVEPSGGQQQKLAIVRALYKDAPMVILDEPTAALDPVAEFEIYQHFDNLVGGKTAVYISHRLSSCRFCDRIIVFNDGTIIEDGTHDELINIEGGFYANMYNTQAKHYKVSA
ncbi:MAG: ABC transporter ATP-binding protein [Lachnospiraceae bacterium]|nr:ABC transporter ATP-binding protein [Lachnospiraceae bacterium]